MDLCVDAAVEFLVLMEGRRCESGGYYRCVIGHSAASPMTSITAALTGVLRD